ncbi:MAG: hypothetical protein ABFD46_01430, partial [Armatimonadota bacterium]
IGCCRKSSGRVSGISVKSTDKATSENFYIAVRLLLYLLKLCRKNGMLTGLIDDPLLGGASSLHPVVL